MGLVEIVGLILGLVVTWMLGRIPDRVSTGPLRRSSAAEFEASTPDGRQIGVLALMAFVAAFVAAGALTVHVVRANGAGALSTFFLPGAFFLTMEIPAAIFEIVWEVCPVFGRGSIGFESGIGVRRRGLVRAGVALGFDASVLAITAIHHLIAPPS